MGERTIRRSERANGVGKKKKKENEVERERTKQEGENEIVMRKGENAE